MQSRICAWQRAISAGMSSIVMPAVGIGDTQRLRDIETAFAREDVMLAEIGIWRNLVAPEEANAAFTIGKFMEGLRVKPRGTKSAEKMQLRHDVRSLTIECEEPMPVQADGEYLGDRTHITFSSIEHAVRFIA